MRVHVFFFNDLQKFLRLNIILIAFEMMIHLILLILRLIFEVKSSNSTPNFTLLDADKSKIDEKFKKKIILQFEGKGWNVFSNFVKLFSHIFYHSSDNFHAT